MWNNDGETKVVSYTRKPSSDQTDKDTENLPHEGSSFEFDSFALLEK